jgi:predicted nucleic acid-binding protein
VIRGIDTSFMVQLEVLGHPGHVAARNLRDQLLAAGDTFALAPQVLAEFLHVVTDGNRFERPLAMNEARERVELWWGAREIVSTFPNAETVPRFASWISTHQLGR